MAALTDVPLDSNNRPASSGSNTVKTIDGLIAFMSSFFGEGWTPHTRLSSANINATSLKALGGRVFSVDIVNNTAAPIWFKFFDQSTAPAPASDSANIKRSIMVPPKVGDVPGVYARSWPGGIVFASGIGYVAVTADSDASVGAIGAGDLRINVDFA